MRRRLNLEGLSDQIVVVLHHNFFDDKVEYRTFQQIRESLKGQPANAVRMELEALVRSHKVVQKTVERTRLSGLSAITGQGATTYDEPVDGYKISKSGIQYVEKLEDEYFAQLEAELGLESDSPNLIQSEQDQWKPIPLERSNELQQRAAKALDELVEDLRGDNGYASSHPEEKAFVQDKLAAIAKRFKEDSQISWMYIQEFALQPIGMILKRFGGAAIGVAAAAAKDAVGTWLKSKSISLLDDFFK